MTYRAKWLLYAPLGLALIGAGACLVHWAGTLKDAAAGFAWPWVTAGTLALVVLNAGVCLVAQSVIEKIRHELGRP